MKSRNTLAGQCARSAQSLQQRQEWFPPEEPCCDLRWLVGSSVESRPFHIRTTARRVASGTAGVTSDWGAGRCTPRPACEGLPRIGLAASL